MSEFHLICGASGSGKTMALIRKIKENIESKKRCYLLVPEQQAYISERDLPAHLPANAGLWFEIVSFSGLSARVFQKFGGVAKDSADSGTRALLIWDILRQYAKSQPEFQIPGGANSELSSAQLYLSAIDDLKRNGITADQLFSARDTLPDASPLKRKLTDLAVVCSSYSERMQGEDADDRLLRLAKVLQEHSFFSGCDIYVDSFSGFSSSEYAVLKQLLADADSLTVTLCIDRIASAAPHFESVGNTVKRLMKMASDCNCKPIVTEWKRSDKAGNAIDYLEQNLWDFKVHQTFENPDAVVFWKCKNICEECELAAKNILKWKDALGIPFNQIAVIARESDRYRGWLDAALEKYGVPYFLSERNDFSSKPISRLILSALRAIAKNYRAEDIRAMLKTGLCGTDVKKSLLFEQYCETWYISGTKFLRPWNMNPRGISEVMDEFDSEILNSANEVRDALITPLAKLAESCKAAKTFADYSKALYCYLSDIGLPKTLTNRAKEELRLQNRREASETLRLFSILAEILKKGCSVLGDEILTLDDYLSALTILFSTVDMGSVPAVSDCVVVGSASKLRVENIKVAILIGMNEGEFPMTVKESGLLNDADKVFLEGLDHLSIRFNSKLELRSAEELFHVYRAMTKPTEKLVLSYSAIHTDGSESAPSFAYTRAQTLLGVKNPHCFKMSSPESLPETSTPMRYSETPDEKKKILYLSASTVSSYAKCPYRYCISNRIKLREKADGRLARNNDGEYFHYILEHYLKEIFRSGKCPARPTDEEMKNRVRELSVDYFEKICKDTVPLSVEHTFRRLYQTVLTFLRYIFDEQFKDGTAYPTNFEQEFGKSAQNPDSLDPVIIDLKEQNAEIRLNGKIDRIDKIEDEDGIHFRIVDYKSSEHKFNEKDNRNGTDIQLALYLKAFLDQYSGHDATSDYAEFLCFKSGKIEENTTKKKELSVEKLLDDMITAVTEIGCRILSGDAEKTPSKENCRYCPAISFCTKAVREQPF